jgi:hypothetical protein
MTFDPANPAGGEPAFVLSALGDSGTDSALDLGFITSKNA